MMKRSLLLSILAAVAFTAVLRPAMAGKKVIYLPYWNYDTPCPEVDYPDNLVIMSAMTTYPMPLKAQRGNFEDAIQRVRDFRTRTSFPVTTWDYSVAWTYGPYQYPHVVLLARGESPQVENT